MDIKALLLELQGRLHIACPHLAIHATWASCLSISSPTGVRAVVIDRYHLRLFHTRVSISYTDSLPICFMLPRRYEPQQDRLTSSIALWGPPGSLSGSIGKYPVSDINMGVSPHLGQGFSSVSILPIWDRYDRITRGKPIFILLTEIWLSVTGNDMGVCFR